MVQIGEQAITERKDKVWLVSVKEIDIRSVQREALNTATASAASAAAKSASDTTEAATATTELRSSIFNEQHAENQTDINW